MYSKNEKECPQNGPSIDISTEAEENYLIEVIPVEADEDDDEDYPSKEGTTASDTEETNNHIAMDEEYVDHKTLDDCMQFECVRTL